MGKITKEIVREVEKEARKYFEGASGCHDWTHVERVKNLALNIGKKEGAKLDVLEMAALLHDIGRRDEMKCKGKFCHAEKGAEIAREILGKHKIEKSVVENIIHCIQAHRYRKNLKPSTLEAKILFDADKLDSIGAIGVARDFLFAGGAGSCNLYTGNEKKLAKEEKDYSFTKEDSAVLEYEIKLKFIKNKMLTKNGKKIANERHKFMKDFFVRFWKEVKGVI